MKLVVFFRSSKPHIISGEAELLKATVRFALVGVCYISEEHARLLFEMKHDSLGAKELAGDVSNVNRTIVLVFLQAYIGI